MRNVAYPFLSVFLALWVLFLAHRQSKNNAALYLDDFDDFDGNKISSSLGTTITSSSSSSTTTTSGDDGNTFTGSQVDGDEDADADADDDDARGASTTIGADMSTDFESFNAALQMEEEDNVSGDTTLGEFLCPAGKLMSPSKKCVSMSGVPVYTPPLERLNVKIFPDLTDFFDAHRAKGCGKVLAHRMPETGFGAIVNYAIYEYAQAVKSGNQQFDFASHSLPGFSGKTCGDQSLACYLQPLSKCERSTIDANQKEFQKAEERAILMPVAASPSFFHYHAAAASRVWRPNADFAKKVRDLKIKMGWPVSAKAIGDTEDYANKIISVHVRKGDACVSEARVQKHGKCGNFGRYAKEIQRIRNAYGKDVFNLVFLATDDDNTVKEARADAKKNGYRLMVAPVDRTWYSPKTWEKNRAKYSKGMNKRRRESEHFKIGFIERRLRAGDGDPDRVGTETAVDVELLASGHAFVGTFTSNLGRLAYEIMSARLQRIPPFASIDGKGWYYGQSKCREKNSKKNPCPVATWMQSHADASRAKTTKKKPPVAKASATSSSRNSKSTTKFGESRTIAAARKRAAAAAKVGIRSKKN